MSLQYLVTFINSNQSNTIFEGEANTMSLIFTNQGEDINIGASTPAYPPASGQFEIYVSFSQVCAQESLQITGANFTATYNSEGQGWLLTATESVDWENNAELTFSVGNLTPDVQPGSYYIGVEVWANSQSGEQDVPAAVQDSSAGAALPVSFSYQPDSVYGGSANQVFITKTVSQPMNNSLTLQIVNTSNQPLVSQPWGSSPPTFTISFVCGAAPPGYNALTTPDMLAAATVAPNDPTNWSVSGPSGSPPVWLLTPTPANGQVIAPGVVAEFTLTGLETQFAPGPAMAYLQSNYFPGYADGMLGIALQKIYAVLQIKQFQLDRTTPYPVAGLSYATGYLGWQVDNAVLVQLECVPQVTPLQGFPFGVVAPSGSSYQVMIQQSQTFVLTAIDPLGKSIQSQIATANTVPELEERWMPVGAILCWSGPYDQIPNGYAPCDGTNGSPNFSDLFIIGAGGDVAWGAMPSGGNAHSHTMSQMTGPQTAALGGAHPHGVPTAWYGQGLSTGKGHTGIQVDGDYSSSQIQSGGAHTHSVTVDFSSSGTEANVSNIRPPWYALYYIIKTAS